VDSQADVPRPGEVDNADAEYRQDQYAISALDRLASTGVFRIARYPAHHY
jgi:hypothetical protein